MILGTCSLFGLPFPGGSCAQWFSGTISAIAVAIALGGYFWTELRFRRSEKQCDLEDVAGAMVVLVASLDEAYANSKMLKSIKREIKIADKEFQITQNVAGLLSSDLPSLDKRQVKSLIKNGGRDLAISINKIAKQNTYMNANMEHYAERRESFSGLLDDLINKGLDVSKSEIGNFELQTLERRAKLIEQYALSLIEQSERIFADTVIICERFNNFCSKKHSEYGDFTIDLDPYQSEA